MKTEAADDGRNTITAGRGVRINNEGDNDDGTYELESRTLRLLLTTELEAGGNISIYSKACERRYALLAALEGHLHLVLADGALQTEDDLLGRLCLLVEDGLGLTTVTGLLAVVTALALRGERVLALLVLRHLVGARIRSSVGFASRA